MRVTQKKYIAVIVLVFFIILGAYLRLKNLDRWTWAMVGYDESRDMLVARHIVEFREHIWRGPLAAGSKNILMNSPLYYYIISFFWLIGRSPNIVMVLWSLMMTGLIFVGYHIGLRYRDSTTGLCIAALISVHPEFIAMSRQLGQPQLIPVWLIFVFFLLFNKKRLTPINFSVSMGLLFISLHIHYGALIIFPAVFSWIFLRWMYESKFTKVYSLLYGIAFSEFMGMIWVWLTYQSTIFDQFSFVHIYTQTSYVSIGQGILKVLREVSYMVFPGLHIFWIVFILFSCILIVVSQLFDRSISKYFRISTIGILMSFAFSILLAGCYKGHLSPTYVYSSVTVVILILGIASRRLMQVNKVLGSIVIAFLIVYFLKYSFNKSNFPPTVSHYKQHQRVAYAIYSDYKTLDKGLGIPSFVLATLSVSPYLVYDGWGTGSTWFWLEKYFDRRLVRLTDTITNFYPLVQTPLYFYVICDHRDDSSLSSICSQRFTSVRNYISDTNVTIFSSSTYTVWRYKILRPVVSYNTAYYELLHPIE